MSQRFTIGQLARRAGVGVETVRFYERQGLLAPPPRGTSGYRQYPEDAVARLHFIRRAKALGFSLREIRELLSLQVDPTGSSGEVQARAHAKLAAIDGKIRTLRQMRQRLVRLSTACDGRAPLNVCPILKALETHEQASGSEEECAPF